MTGSGGAVRLEVPRDGVAVIVLDRPEKRNALSAALTKSLIEHLKSISTDSSVGCAVLTGAPPAFSAGGDLRELAATSVSAVGSYFDGYRALSAAFRSLSVPVIAAVNGAAVAGGFELMCLCDMRIVADTAEVGVGDVDLGLVPTSGLTWLLPRMVGSGTANWLMLTNHRLRGRELVAVGLAEESLPASEVVPRAVAVAGAIADMPGDGVRLTREALDHAAASSYAAALDFEIEANKSAFDNPAVRRALDDFGTRRGDRTTS